MGNARSFLVPFKYSHKVAYVVEFSHLKIRLFAKNQIVTDAVSLMQAGKINEAIAQLNEISPPNGVIETVENGTKIIARNWDGSPLEHIFQNVDGFQNLGLIRKVDDAGKIEIFQKAFGSFRRVCSA